MRTILALLTALAVSGCSGLNATLVSESTVYSSSVDYEHDGEALQGILSWSPDFEGPRPGVLVIHEWWGRGDHPAERARELAKEGYVAFALDMYGTGKLTDDPAQAQTWSRRFYGEENRDFARRRAAAGLEMLRSATNVDPDRLAVMGFCFGGTQALELAWSGADLRGAVSFHGSLTTPREEDIAGVKASILVCHGAADRFVPDDSQVALRDTLNEAGIDWLMVSYGSAVHSFTNAVRSCASPGGFSEPLLPFPVVRNNGDARGRVDRPVQSQRKEEPCSGAFSRSSRSSSRPPESCRGSGSSSASVSPA
ncbi:MAG: dienelactone hydrolase family protein [Planctomycetota bacterium]|jgi:dienelactone hydrolase